MSEGDNGKFSNALFSVNRSKGFLTEVKFLPVGLAESYGNVLNVSITSALSKLNFHSIAPHARHVKY